MWTEKSMYGRKYMGILRSAFLVDEKGKLADVWYKVSPKDTPKNLLAARLGRRRPRLSRTWPTDSVGHVPETAGEVRD